MEGIIVIILIFFVIGLFFRNKGDGFVDTVGSGAFGCLSWIITIIVIGLIIFFLLK